MERINCPFLVPRMDKDLEIKHGSLEVQVWGGRRERAWRG
jgi:hypothetical protein